MYIVYNIYFVCNNFKEKYLQVGIQAFLCLEV